MAYDGSIKIDTKVDTGGFSTGVDKIKSIATKGVAALTTTFTAVSGAIVAGGTAATHVGSDFEAAMSKVSAISGATGKDLTALTNKAKEMGASTKFSASESASALQYMAMAGWDTSDMLSGISGIMSLAAADGLDLATTSDIVTDALTAFGMKASDSSHFADVLAKASSSANTNVSMLGESFKYVAPLAGAMGYSAEDVSVALGLMANASIKGSMAGTSLKTALSNLASPTKQMKEVMDKYKLSITDATGKALPLSDVLKQLREKFGGLSEAEQTAAASTLFGKEAMSGMLAIINASESDFNNLTKNINNADGAAQLMAETMQNNLQGQITVLKSALEGLGIEIYEGMSAPLKDAAVEAQNYVNRLTSAFKDGGLTGLIEEAGSIFGELAVKAAEAAPKMIEAAIGFIQAFVDGIANNADKLSEAAVNIIQTLISCCVKNAPKLISAAKTIVSTIVNNLVKLLPKDVQKPVKETINNIKKSFESGGLRSAINTVKNVIVNLGNVIKNVAKVILPPLSKAVDFLAGKMKVLLPIITGVFAAYKAYSIFKTITAFITAHTAAVTAESLAEAASTGAITLKQIAVGVLTGEIGLATAAQYAWNLAMSMNPIGAIITAVALLAAGIGALIMTMGNAEEETSDLERAQERLEQANKELGTSYEQIGGKISDFLNDIDSAGNIFDNFNEKILISDEEKQALSDNMDSVQSKITEICRLAAEKRGELTDGEVQRLEELFQTMHSLSEQELALEQSKQGVVTSQAEALNNAAGISLDEYTQRAQTLSNTAEQTRVAVIDKAYEQYTEEVALLDLRLKNDKNYSQKEHDQAVAAADKKYQAAIAAANKEAGDTLDILQKGYLARAEALRSGNETLTQLNSKEVAENKKHADKKAEIEAEYNRAIDGLKYKQLNNTEFIFERQKIFDKKDKDLATENTRHKTEQAKIAEEQQKVYGDKNYRTQLANFMGLEALYEVYAGKTNTSAKNIVDNFFQPMQGMDEETRKKFQDSLNGAINGIEDKKMSLYYKADEIADGFISRFRRIFNINSPSKVFKQLFGYTIEGAEIGTENEAKNLYKTADKVGGTFTKRMRESISVGSLIARMREGVAAGKELLTETLTSRMLHDVNLEVDDSNRKVLHDVNLEVDDSNRKVYMKGDIYTTVEIDGREAGVALAPYVSEEMAWQGGV